MLTAPEIEWQGNTPYAPLYGDVYFSRQDGIGESQHNFLAGCGIPRAWQAKPQFTIGETGFGTGLNFLLTCTTWQAYKPANGYLTYLSFEKHPWPRDALQKLHAAWPQFAPATVALYDAYPPLKPGLHLCAVAPDITLLLAFGEAVDILPAITGQVDAWYLDGFAPAKNPDLWSAPVINQIGRLSRPGTRLATFTAAGFVKDNLTAAGFAVTKTPGFMHKRNRIVATYCG